MALGYVNTPAAVHEVREAYEALWDRELLGASLEVRPQKELPDCPSTPDRRHQAPLPKRS